MRKTVLLLIMLVLLNGCAEAEDKMLSPMPEGNPQVEIRLENGDAILLELDRIAAPVTVENFVNLVNEQFYDGLTFHRVVAGFVIQSGSPSGMGSGGSEQPIYGEFASNGWENPISHVRGVISMARRDGEPDSASSQFFITLSDAVKLDGDYAAFGHVIEGMDVVDSIGGAETNFLEQPVTDIVIESIKIIDWIKTS